MAAEEPSERSMRDRMLAGELYLADDPEIQAEFQRGQALSEEYNRTPISGAVKRRELLEELLGGIGEGTEIRAPFHVDYGSRIFIGARTFANFGLMALDVAEIRIGDDVQIGPNVQLLTATHPTDPDLRRDKWESGEPISIGNNVWLGGGAIVLPGITIGDNTVVGAGAVVTRNLPSDVIAVGSPAHVVRHLADG